jgi:hypothetical protein
MTKFQKAKTKEKQNNNQLYRLLPKISPTNPAVVVVVALLSLKQFEKPNLLSFFSEITFAENSARTC